MGDDVVVFFIYVFGHDDIGENLVLFVWTLIYLGKLCCDRTLF